MPIIMDGESRGSRATHIASCISPAEAHKVRALVGQLTFLVCGSRALFRPARATLYLAAAGLGMTL